MATVEAVQEATVRFLADVIGMLRQAGYSNEVIFEEISGTFQRDWQHRMDPAEYGIAQDLILQAIDRVEGD